MKNTILGKEQPGRVEETKFKISAGLAAIEFGKTDESLFEYIKFFTEQIPCEKKTFVHVVPDMSLLANFYNKTGDIPFSKYDIKDQLAMDLATAINQHFPTEEALSQYAVLEGDPLKELLGMAEDVAADLLFIGQDTTKGYHNILAKNLIRKTKANALIVPDTAPTKLTRMLVPIDFSLNSKKALETAVGINRQLKEPIPIICMHVFEMPNLSHYKISRSLVSFKDSVKRDHKEALEKFLESIPMKERRSIFTQLVFKDLPGTANYIMDAVKKDKADLVIMGVKGTSKVETLLMGSVADKFLTINTSVPTLIVR